MSSLFIYTILIDSIYNINFGSLYMTDNYTPQESWNMATETLKRLSRCLDMISFYSQNGSLIRWFDASMDLRRNLAPFLTKEEFDEIDSKIKSMPQGWILSRYADATGGKVNPMHYATCHRILDETYIMFINQMKQKGLLMPKVVDPRMAVIN